MKWNWGTGIFFFYGCFALSLVVVVVKSRSFDNSLVVKDYYAKDITYQNTIDAKRNSAALTTPLALAVRPDHCILSFPVKELTGTVTGTLHFYRPSSQRHDQLFRIKPDRAGSVSVTTEGLEPGYYRAIVEWKAGSTPYWNEFPVFVESRGK